MHDLDSTETLPDHKDKRSHTPYSQTNWGVVGPGLDKDRILAQAALMLEEQYIAQYRRWRFRDDYCKRVVGAEQERPSGEEAERGAVEELRIVHTKFKRKPRGWPEGKKRRARTVRPPSEASSKFESET